MTKVESRDLTPMKIDKTALKITFIRSPGPGGQNVNKVATGVLLRFNVLNTHSLTDEQRARLLSMLGNKVTSNGEIIIKAVRYRTQERNKQDAFARLETFISRALIPIKKRKKTKPSKASIERRLTTKKQRGKVKLERGRKLNSEF